MTFFLPGFQESFFIFFYIFLMEYIALAKGIALLAIIGPGIGVGLIGMGVLNAIARNPGAKKDLMAPMFITLASAELLGLLGFVALFLIN